MDVVLSEYSPQGLWVTCRRDGLQVTGLDERAEPAAIGTQAMLTMDMNKAYWFDTATGKTLRAPG